MGTPRDPGDVDSGRLVHLDSFRNRVPGVRGRPPERRARPAAHGGRGVALRHGAAKGVALTSVLAVIRALEALYVAESRAQAAMHRADLAYRLELARIEASAPAPATVPEAPAPRVAVDKRRPRFPWELIAVGLLAATLTAASL